MNSIFVVEILRENQSGSLLFVLAPGFDEVVELVGESLSDDEKRDTQNITIQHNDLEDLEYFKSGTPRVLHKLSI